MADNRGTADTGGTIIQASSEVLPDVRILCSAKPDALRPSFGGYRGSKVSADQAAGKSH